MAISSSSLVYSNFFLFLNILQVAFINSILVLFYYSFNFLFFCTTTHQEYDTLYCRNHRIERTSFFLLYCTLLLNIILCQLYCRNNNRIKKEPCKLLKLELLALLGPSVYSAPLWSVMIQYGASVSRPKMLYPFQNVSSIPQCLSLP